VETKYNQKYEVNNIYLKDDLLKQDLFHVFGSKLGEKILKADEDTFHIMLTELNLFENELDENFIKP